jgi:CBS domain-containing protein
VTCSPMDPLSRVIGSLKESEAYEAFVEEEEQTGVVSLRDILNSSDQLETKLSTLVRYIPRLAPGNTVGDAAALMHEHRIRSLPVYKARELIGQITSPTIVGKLLDKDLAMRSSNVMTASPISIDASSELAKARSVMIRRKVDQLPVTKDGRLSGAITSSDIVFGLAPEVDRNEKGERRHGRFSTPIGLIASEEAVTNSIEDSPRQIYLNLVKRRSNYSIVLSVEEIQGIITYRDFMKPLLKPDADEIPMYIVGLPDDPFEAETARMKFTRAIKFLKKDAPEITEARAVIKMGETESPKKKYQVMIFIMSPRRHYSYEVFSYELADAFDSIDAWVKKIAAQEKPARRRTREDPGFDR